MSYSGPALAPLNPGVMLEALRHDPVGVALPLLVSTGLFVAVLRAAKQAGRGPNLAGWMLGPALGVMLGAGFLLLGLLDAFEWARCGTQDRVCGQKVWTFHWGLMFALPPLEAALAWGGVLLGGASLHKVGRAHGASLGLMAALLLSLAGAVEGHRAMLGAWSQSLWVTSEANQALTWQLTLDAYQLKLWMLRYAGLLAVLLGVGASGRWRAGAPDRRRALGLALGVCCALGLSLWGVDRAQALRGWSDPDPWGPPVELARPWRSGFVPDSETPPPFPARGWGVGVVEARYVELP